MPERLSPKDELSAAFRASGYPPHRIRGLVEQSAEKLEAMLQRHEEILADVQESGPRPDQPHVVGTVDSPNPTPAQQERIVAALRNVLGK